MISDELTTLQAPESDLTNPTAHQGITRSQGHKGHSRVTAVPQHCYSGVTAWSVKDLIPGHTGPHGFSGKIARACAVCVYEEYLTHLSGEFAQIPYRKSLPFALKCMFATKASLSFKQQGLPDLVSESKRYLDSISCHALYIPIPADSLSLADNTSPTRGFVLPSPKPCTKER